MSRPNISILCMALGLSLAACQPTKSSPQEPVDPCTAPHPSEDQQVACLDEQFDAIARAIDKVFPNEPQK